MREPSGMWTQFSVAPRGIRNKLLLGFVLMSAIPVVMLLLVAAWFAFPQVREFYGLERYFPLIASSVDATWWLVGVLTLTVVISLLGGLYVTVKLIEPVIRLSEDAKGLAEGDWNRELPVTERDELGELTLSLNQLTAKIRDNMTELRSFGERTTQINLEIHKRVVTLSGLLQIGEAISNAVEFETVMDLIVEKVALLEERGFTFLCLQPMEHFPTTLRRAFGIPADQLEGITFDSSQAVIDAAHPPSPLLQPIWEHLGRPNLLLQPVLVRNRLAGVVGVGNRHSQYRWSAEQHDLITVFVKQASIALENELLVRKTRAMAIHDELTGLYNERYIRQRLEEEIRRAIRYQRPCALAMFVVQHYDDYRRRHGEPEAERALKRLAKLVRAAVSDIDQVGRFDGNELVVLLPERNKREATELAEHIRRSLEAAFPAGTAPDDHLRLVGAVAENPVDGASAEALISKASALLRRGHDAVAAIHEGGPRP